ncbi:cyclin N-terminal domain-containing protein 1 [Solea solea]|uniref:cyclin N-terminal domain-containing protein 1 n=1 Tax=Solea solea TaxID=90069 RepID=UPI00272B8D03|nr:cyclin N-terminal domain-containing protein 1 [Solea solea]
MAKQLIHCKFREASGDLLMDFLINLNKRNKENLSSLSKCNGVFKDKRVVEYILLITREMRLDPLVGYHAIELLQRFMVKHLRNLFTAHTSAGDQPRRHKDSRTFFDKIKEKFPILIFSCVQLASKLSLYSQIINNKTAVQFLHSVGIRISAQSLFESEMMILKALEFRLHVPNPLTYMEILLEVLGHNEPSIHVERLYDMGHHVLQFVSLQRTPIYETLLKTISQCLNPTREQREKFATVTEDNMLLGVTVIAVATFILYVKKWEQVVGELSHITGISKRSISDFTHVILMQINGSSSHVTSA